MIKCSDARAISNKAIEETNRRKTEQAREWADKALSPLIEECASYGFKSYRIEVPEYISIHAVTEYLEESGYKITDTNYTRNIVRIEW